MIDLVITSQDDKRSTNDFTRLNDDEVKQIRRDPDGTVVETVYSLKQGGNVVAFSASSSSPQRVLRTVFTDGASWGRRLFQGPVNSRLQHRESRRKLRYIG